MFVCVCLSLKRIVHAVISHTSFPVHPNVVISQEFGLARFKSNQVKAMKGLEHVLANQHGMSTTLTLASVLITFEP